MAKHNLFGFTKQSWWILFPTIFAVAGKFLDDKETERMTRFRDKSALYGRKLEPGEPPSWPTGFYF